MKRLLRLVLVAALIASSSRAESDFADSTVVADFTAKALATTQLDAIAVVAISKDMHLRMGYQNQVHSGRLVLEALRLLPAYVVDTVYSRSALPRFIFVFDESNYFPDDPNVPNEPFTKLLPYPDAPIMRLVFLKRVDPLKYALINRGTEPEFVAHANSARQSGVSLAEVMKFVDMDKLVTTNSVFALLDWGAAFPISSSMPELPPTAKGEKLLIPDYQIKHVDDAKAFSLPAAFADDAKKVAVTYKEKKRTTSTDLGLSTDVGKQLAEKLWGAEQKRHESK